MERLPPELLASVCSFSDIRSLKKLRLVNNTFADIAAKYLFESLHVTLIPRYLHKVTEVAHHPTLRFHVHTLFFHEDLLNQDFAEYKIWKAEVEKVQCPQADLERCRTYTCDLLAEQEAFLDDRMDFAILPAALAMFSNLQRIGPIYECRRARDLKNVQVPIISDVQRNTLLEDPFLGALRSNRHELARPLVSLLRGLGLTRRRILNMEINAIPWSFWKWSFWKEGAPSGVQKSTSQLIYAAFQHLESMDVCIVVDCLDLEVSLRGILPLSITSFLGAAHSLRRLQLEFEGQDRDASVFTGANWIARTTPRVGSLFATLTLPSLAMLTIAHCILTEESFIGFIQRHATTLKSLRLTKIFLHNQPAELTSWERVWKQLAPIVNLDVILLRDTLDDDYLQDFASHGKLDLGPYHNALEFFISNRGQTECPKWSEFLSWRNQVLLVPCEEYVRPW